jgi:hypothetical protein
MNPTRRTVLQIVVGVVVLAVAAAIVLGVTLGSHPSAQPTQSAAPTSVAKAVGSVPASVFDRVGVGSATTPPRKVDGAKLTDGQKPLVIYVGGEFCPFCAAERWPLAVALARFGAFSNLGETTSASAPEVYPDTATLSFHGATFTSDHVALTAKEVQDRDHKQLDQLTDAEQQLLATYDAPPYVQTAGSIPFISIGGTWQINGAQYDPALLKGKTHAQIAAALSEPDSKIAQAVIGSANLITVALCAQTGGQPADVCQSPGVKAAATAMGVG